MLILFVQIYAIVCLCIAVLFILMIAAVYQQPEDVSSQAGRHEMAREISGLAPRYVFFWPLIPIRLLAIYLTRRHSDGDSTDNTPPPLM